VADGARRCAHLKHHYRRRGSWCTSSGPSTHRASRAPRPDRARRSPR
jgi:hypothetical protein